MKTISEWELAYELKRAGVKVKEIARRVGKHRATVHRWLSGIRYEGMRRFTQQKKEAKRHRHRQCLDAVTVRIIKEIREEYGYCGEKIVYLLKRDYGRKVSLSSVYRVLRRYFILRKKIGRNVWHGDVPRAKKPREVLQFDTMDLGELYVYSGIDIYTRQAAVMVGESLEAAEGRRLVKKIMKEKFGGYAEVIQSDNGPEFESVCHQEICARSVWHRRIRPYKKNENAFVESLNHTLRKECVGWTKYKKQDKFQLQQALDEYLKFYHEKRPHMGLNMLTPNEFVKQLQNHQVSHL